MEFKLFHSTYSDDMTPHCCLYRKEFKKYMIINEMIACVGRSCAAGSRLMDIRYVSLIDSLCCLFAYVLCRFLIALPRRLAVIRLRAPSKDK